MIRIKVVGNSPEYFLKKLIIKNIRYSNLNIFYKELIFDISYYDYKKLLDIKTSYEISIIEYRGIYKYFFFLMNYWYIILFFLIGVFNVLFFSNIIFDVEVIHSNNYIKELVYSKLKYYGIDKYKFKVSFNEKEEIINKILEDESNNLEWLEIEEIGSKYMVKVEQRKKDDIGNECGYRHVVAKKDAMITSIFASIGEVVKKKYDYVKKGDILISGFIHNKEEVMSKKCATGTVIGEVWYKVNISLPDKYYEERITGDKSTGIEFILFNKNISLFKEYGTYQVNRKTILKNKLLPIGIYYSTYLETKIVNKKYDINTVDEDALELAVEKLYKRLGNDISIKSQKVLKKEEKESKIIVEVFIKVEEDITDYFDITNINNELNNSSKE